jgi:hypothetical protein
MADLENYHDKQRRRDSISVRKENFERKEERKVPDRNDDYLDEKEEDATSNVMEQGKKNAVSENK